MFRNFPAHVPGGHGSSSNDGSSDSGSGSDQEQDLEAHAQQQPGSRCGACGADTAGAPTTVHCKLCDVCVAGWDHHCGWVGSCVGERNHRHFWVYLAAQTLVAGSAFDLVLTSRVGVGSARRELVAFWCLLLFLAFAVIAIGTLLAFHSLLALSGMTSREVVHRMRGHGALAGSAAHTAQRRTHHRGGGSGGDVAKARGSGGFGGSCSSALRNLGAFVRGEPRGASLPYGHPLPPRARPSMSPLCSCCGAQHACSAAQLLRALDTLCDNKYYSCC
jgi:hypothetical protein